MTRYIAIVVGKAPNIDPERLQCYPDVEVYHVSGPDAEHHIDMALLSDLHRPVKLVFVGGEEAGRYASVYHGVWIVDGPTAVTDVLRCWNNDM